VRRDLDDGAKVFRCVRERKVAPLKTAVAESSCLLARFWGTAALRKWRSRVASRRPSLLRAMASDESEAKANGVE
jgi:hypothetical protein